MPTDYLAWQRDVLSPPWLQQPRGDEWAATVGAEKDAIVAATKDSVKAARIALAPEDSLGRIGDDTGWERYPGETLAAWRARLLIRFDRWKLAGTKEGLELALIAAGFVGSVITTAHEANPLDTNWSRFWVELNAPFPAWTGYPGFPGAPTEWQPRAWGDTSFVTLAPYKWGDLSPDGTEFVWGSTASVKQVGLLKRLIHLWRPAHVICEQVVVNVSLGGGTLYWRIR